MNFFHIFYLLSLQVWGSLDSWVEILMGVQKTPEVKCSFPRFRWGHYARSISFFRGSQVVVCRVYHAYIGFLYCIFLRRCSVLNENQWNWASAFLAWHRVFIKEKQRELSKKYAFSLCPDKGICAEVGRASAFFCRNRVFIKEKQRELSKKYAFSLCPDKGICAKVGRASAFFYRNCVFIKEKQREWRKKKQKFAIFAMYSGKKFFAHATCDSRQ